MYKSHCCMGLQTNAELWTIILGSVMRIQVIIKAFISGRSHLVQENMHLNRPCMPE